MSNTRTLWNIRTQEPFNQRAIPWCTTHDSLAYAAWELTYCQIASPSKAARGECVISEGPPDHFWWVDE